MISPPPLRFMRTELCLFSAANAERLLEDVRQLLRFLDHARDASLQDIAFTLALSYQPAPARLAVVAETTPELRNKLTQAAGKIASGVARIKDRNGVYYHQNRELPGKMVFLFPGEFAAHPEMTRDLCLAYPFCRDPFDDADQACRTARQPFPLASWIFPPSGSPHTGGHLQNMAASIQASHAANTLFARLFDKLEIQADAVAGTSSGEVAALEYASVFGYLPRPQRVNLLRAIPDALQEINSRSGITPLHLVSFENPSPEFVADMRRTLGADVLPVLESRCGHYIFAVQQKAVPRVRELLAANPGFARHIPFDCAFHTPFFEPALRVIQREIESWVLRLPRLPVYSFATAAPLPDEIHALRETLARQWVAPVRFDDTIDRLYEDGHRIFVELGTRGNLTPMVGALLKGKPHLAVAANRVHRSDVPQLHHALAQLAVNGVAMRPEALHTDRNSRALRFDRPSVFQTGRTPPVRLNAALSNLGGLPPPPAWSPGAAPAEAETAPAPDTQATATQRPLLRNATVTTNQENNSLQADLVLSLKECPFLRDESFGTTRVSAIDADLRGYTVLNLATALELMVEAAADLAPGKVLYQALQLKALQWIGFDKDEIGLSITVVPADWPDKRFSAFDVRLHASTPSLYASPPTISATLLFMPSPPPPPAAQPKPLTNPLTVNWSGQDIYPDRSISGPLTRAITHVGLWSDDGIDFDVVEPDVSKLICHTPTPAFLAFPLLVDALGSGLTVWQAPEKFNGHLALPFRVRSITYHTTHIPPAARLRAYLRITAASPRSRTANMLLTDGQGRVLIEISGWEALRCEVSPKMHRFVLRSSENYFTQELPAELFENSPVPVSASIATGYPTTLFTENQSLWLRVLAFVLLSPPEREEWLGMRATHDRRVEWLLGRAAAKEATRRLLLHQYHQHFNAPDIPIWADDSGKPVPYGPWQDVVPAKIDLSIAHTPGLIMAAAAPDARIGIDVEHISRDLTEAFSRNVFTPEEHELAAASGDGPGAIMRFWCAKEAFSKALGTGIRYSAADLRVREYEARTGRITIEAVSQWTQALSDLPGTRFPIQTALYQSHVFASCVLPLAASK